MQLIIAPAPSASPSVILSPTPTPAATTASVGTPSPLPVNVIDDPDPDGVEIAGLVFAILGLVVSAIASGVSIFLAWRAVKIGQQANAAAVKAAEEAERANEEASKARAAVASERRRTFELEVLRDVMAVIDSSVITSCVDYRSGISTNLGGRLAMLPNDDLPEFRRLQAMAVERADVKWLVLLNGHLNAGVKPHELQHSKPMFVEQLKARLRADVLASVRRRMDARDD